MMFPKTGPIFAMLGLLVGHGLTLTTEFSILTMNVAGLPPIFNSNDVPGDKETNARTIGSLFAKYGYDIINIQEVSLEWISSLSGFDVDETDRGFTFLPPPS